MWWTRNHLGTYEPTGEISISGSAVYNKTTSGYSPYLYKARDCTWRTSGDVDGDGDAIYKSVDTAPCPADIRQWQYINNQPHQHDGTPFWQDGDITAKCSVQS